MKRHEEFEVSERPMVDVDMKSGSLEVRASTDGRIAVTLDGDDVDDWTIAQLGNTVSIRSPAKRIWRGRSARLLVEAPSRSDLDIATASADVTCSGGFGEARVRTASGNLRAGTFSRLDATSASGDIDIADVDNDVSCSTASGDVEAGEVRGRFTASTASGDVRVAVAHGDVEASTASGDVRVRRFHGSMISAKCMSGDIDLGLPAGIRVEPEISTMSGRTTLPKPATNTSNDVERRIVRVKLRTMSGDITITRA